MTVLMLAVTTALTAGMYGVVWCMARDEWPTASGKALAGLCMIGPATLTAACATCWCRLITG